MDICEYSNLYPRIWSAGSPMVGRGSSNPVRIYVVYNLKPKPSPRTISFDDMGPVGEDTRWENRAELANYLVTAFPRM